MSKVDTFNKVGLFLIIAVIVIGIGLPIVVGIIENEEQNRPESWTAEGKAELYDIGIYDPWALSSLSSVCGIIFFIICLLPYAGGFMKGLVWNCSMCSVMLIIVLCFNCMSEKPECLTLRHPRYGKIGLEDVKHTVDAREDMELGEASYRSKDDPRDPDYIYTPGDISDKYRIYTTIYAMHSIDAENSFYVSPRIFHPAAFLYAPLFLGGLIFVGLGMRNLK
jgi:hypothetical protein